MQSRTVNGEDEEEEEKGAKVEVKRDADRDLDEEEEDVQGVKNIIEKFKKNKGKREKKGIKSHNKEGDKKTDKNKLLSFQDGN